MQPATGRIWRALAAWVLMWSFSSSAVAAGNGASPEPPRDLARRLIAWIAAHSEYPAPAIPRIVFLPTRELARRFHGDDAGGPLRVEALYHHPSATIYLCDCWDPDDPVDQSALLHELVHHMQATSHAQGPCRGALEAEPYRLQAEWLSEQGYADPYEAIGIDRFTVEVLSGCD